MASTYPETPFQSILPQKQTAPRLVELPFLWAESWRLLQVFVQSLEERPSVFFPGFIPVLISMNPHSIR